MSDYQALFNTFLPPQNALSARLNRRRSILTILPPLPAPRPPPSPPPPPPRPASAAGGVSSSSAS